MYWDEFCPVVTDHEVTAQLKYTIEGVDKIPILLKQAYFPHLWK